MTSSPNSSSAFSLTATDNESEFFSRYLPGETETREKASLSSVVTNSFNTMSYTAMDYYPYYAINPTDTYYSSHSNYWHGNGSNVTKRKWSQKAWKPEPQCPVCLKYFTREAAVKVHMRIHTGEKPFACLLCDQRFSQSGHLKCHMRIHTGEKPFVCFLCDRRFSQSGNLRIHMKTHQDILNSSEHLSSLRSHMKPHERRQVSVITENSMATNKDDYNSSSN